MKLSPPFRALIRAAILLVMVSVIAFGLFKNSRSVEVAPGSSTYRALILWAWERPEDLSYIDPKTTEVAFLARTIYLRGSRVVVRPRLQPLRLPDGVTVIPVTRIESDRQESPTYSSDQLESTVQEIAKTASLPHVRTIQLDFDATTSERQFYTSLIAKLRQSMPATTRLSITALASWCEGDRWLESLPIDEAVPMLFRMGVDQNSILSTLHSDGFKSPRCQTSSGVSTDELITNLPGTGRLYVFNPTSWTEDAVRKAMEMHKHEPQRQ